MGIGARIKNQMMKVSKARARNREYQRAANEQIRKKEEAAYYKAKEEYRIKQAQERAASGGFKGRLKSGLKSYGKQLKAKKMANMGLHKTNMGGTGPQFGLSNNNATNVNVNRDIFSLGGGSKKKKGPFDL